MALGMRLKLTVDADEYAKLEAAAGAAKIPLEDFLRRQLGLAVEPTPAPVYVPPAKAVGA